jgi:TolA-binding protein
MTKRPEDLSARSRRGSLDEEETARLRLALRSSAEARLLHRAGMDFDVEDRVQPGDEALAERIARRVLADAAPRTTRRRRPFAPIAIAAILATGAAAAAAGPTALGMIESLIAPAEPENELPQERAQRATPRASGSRAAPLAVRGPSNDETDRSETDEPGDGTIRPTEPNGEAARAEVAHAPKIGARHTTTPLPPPAEREVLHSSAEPPPDTPTSGTLFRDANRARREGNAAQALALYETLQRDHPSAAESDAADIPLGMLHAQSGTADRAVRHFERYLAAAPSGPLAPEALFGLAQAHASAGRSVDARRVWTDLLARFPDSAYAGAARAKLHGSR